MTPRKARIEFDGGVVCERCLVADSFRFRLRGLLGHRGLRSDERLLVRSGFSVARATRFADLMNAVEDGRADVVVLDASGPERWTVRAAAALDRAPERVAVLMVADDIDGAPGALAKWGSFDRLVEA